MLRARRCARRNVEMVASCGLALALAAVGVGVSAEARPSTCGPAGGHTLRRSGAVRIYEEAAPGLEPTTPIVYGCAVGQGQVLPLDSPGDLVFAFRGPALALSGHVAGYAAEICDAAVGDCVTNVFALDLSQPTNIAKQNIARHAAAPSGHGVVKVGSLRVNGAGSLAWIACPERTTHNALSARRTPNCVHPGDRDVVLAFSIGAPAARVLDIGKRIDPSSLRLHRARLTWTDGSHTYHAVLR